MIIRVGGQWIIEHNEDISLLWFTQVKSNKQTLVNSHCHICFSIHFRYATSKTLKLTCILRVIPLSLQIFVVWTWSEEMSSVSSCKFSAFLKQLIVIFYVHQYLHRHLHKWTIQTLYRKLRTLIGQNLFMRAIVGVFNASFCNLKRM